MDQRTRGLEQRLRSALAELPVVILEGGRAVGKTWLADQLVAGGVLSVRADLQTLAERERAMLDPAQYLRSFGGDAAIDEAQLVPDLSIAVKQHVDQPTSTTKFLLTGSSRVGRGTLGGADPLAGRAIRLRLRPFTQGELDGEPVDVVSELFEGGFRVGAQYPSATGDALWRRLAAGSTAGLVTRPSERAAQRRSYVESTIHLGVGDSRVDRARIFDVFRALAAHSGDRLNLSSQAGRLNVTRQTLEKYVGLLEDAFLVDRIYCYKTDALARLRTMPKVIVPDVGLVVWALGLEGADRERRQPAVGRLVETLATNEVLAQRDWSDRDIEIYYWRDQGGNEVDLVLVDDAGRLVPIEVKSSTTVRPEMASGVRAFQREFRSFERGYVIYGGDTVVDLGGGVMALPLSCLWTRREDSGMSTTTNQASGPALFVSYVHADDDAEGGRIALLANDLADRYGLMTGEELDVFIDKDLRWGEEWRGRLATELAKATVFVGIVTPRFLRSDPCRQEVLEFTAVADGRGEGLRFCPILYISPGELNNDDPVERLIADHQYVDWQDHRYEDRDSGAYRRAVDGLVAELVDRTAEPVVGVPAEDGPPDNDVLDLMERLGPDIGVVFEQEVMDLVTALTDTMLVFERTGGQLSSATQPSQIRSALRTLAAEAEPTIEHLRLATASVRSTTARVSAVVDSLIENGMTDQLDEMVEGLPDDVEVDFGELEEIRQMLRMMRGFSKDLRPFLDATEEALQLLEDLMHLPATWRRSVEIARQRLRELS